MKIIEQFGESFKIPPCRKRTACRSFITKDNCILLSHLKKTNMYLSVGGGVEKGETLVDCCKREALEEAGLVIKPLSEFLVINEYYRDCLYETHFYTAEITGKGEKRLTENETTLEAEAVWVSFVDALEIFGEYDSFSQSDPERCGQYKREYAALRYFLEEIRKPAFIYQNIAGYSLKPLNTRPSSRGLILKDNKILLVKELSDGTLMSAGGGVEKGESLEECLKREMLEETGFIVNASEHFAEVFEYFEDTLYIGNYFLAEIVGTGKTALTEREESKKTVSLWMDADEALDIFKNLKGLKKVDNGKRSLYKREYTILKKLKDRCL